MADRSSLAASTSAGSVRLAGVVSSAQRRAERLQASWAFSSAGAILLDHTGIDLASSRGSLADDSGGCGDERLHAGDPDQIGRVRVAGECPVRLDLPGGQCGCRGAWWLAGRRPVAGWPAALIRRAAMEPAASCSMASNRAIMPRADSTSSTVGRSTKGWRRRAPTSRRC